MRSSWAGWVSSSVSQDRTADQAGRPSARNGLSDGSANTCPPSRPAAAAAAARSSTCSPIATPTRGASSPTEKTPYGRFATGNGEPSGTGTQLVGGLVGSTSRSAPWSAGRARAGRRPARRCCSSRSDEERAGHQRLGRVEPGGGPGQQRPRRARPAARSRRRVAALGRGVGGQQHVEQPVVLEAGHRVGVAHGVVQPGGALERRLRADAGQDERGDLGLGREQRRRSARRCAAWRRRPSRPAPPSASRHPRCGAARRRPRRRASRRPCAPRRRPGRRGRARAGSGISTRRQRRRAASRRPHRPPRPGRPGRCRRCTPTSTGASAARRRRRIELGRQLGQPRGRAEEPADQVAPRSGCAGPGARRPPRASARCPAGTAPRRRRARRAARGTSHRRMLTWRATLQDRISGDTRRPIIGRRHGTTREERRWPTTAASATCRPSGTPSTAGPTAGSTTRS